MPAMAGSRNGKFLDALPAPQSIADSADMLGRPLHLRDGRSDSCRQLLQLRGSGRSLGRHDLCVAAAGVLEVQRSLSRSRPLRESPSSIASPRGAEPFVGKRGWQLDGQRDRPCSARAGPERHCSYSSTARRDSCAGGGRAGRGDRRGYQRGRPCHAAILGGHSRWYNHGRAGPGCVRALLAEQWNAENQLYR